MITAQQHAKIALRMHDSPAYRNDVFRAFAKDLLDGYRNLHPSAPAQQITPYDLLHYSQHHEAGSFIDLCDTYDMDAVHTLSELLLEMTP